MTSKKTRLRRSEFILFLSILIFLISLAFNVRSDVFNYVNACRFYFGFLIFYLIFKKSDTFSIPQYYWLIVLLLLIETLLINTIVNARSMPNFPDGGTHFVAFGYQRPYSFGRNASVASTLFIVLTAMKFKFQLKGLILAFFTTIIFSSGTGFIAFFLYLNAYLWSLMNRFVYVLVIIFSSSIVAYIAYTDVFYKISPTYILHLISLKTTQSQFIFQSILDGELLNILLGAWWAGKSGVNQGGDFGYLLFVENFGIIGLGLFFLAVLSNTNRFNAFGVLIILFSSLHYPTFGFMSGQIVLGYLLSTKAPVLLKRKSRIFDRALA